MSDSVSKDGIVTGTEGDNTLLPGYVDQNGDKIDGMDAILPGTFGNDDVIVAGGGNDRVDAGLGNDLVYGGAGSDTLTGGVGNDTVYGDATLAGVTLSGGSYGGSDGCGSGGSGSVSYNDLIYGGDGQDLLFGELGNDTLYGGNGNDTLGGGPGGNRLFGDAGDDLFIGGAGADSFQGGTGQDNIDYSASGQGVTVNLTTSLLAGGDAANDSILGGIDGVIGSNFGDSLTGFDQQGTWPDDTYSNQFWGRGGNDTIDGKGGNDEIHGGDDQDLLSGGAGDDLVSGDAGNDTIYGGSGRDTITGDAGNDVIDGGSESDRIGGGAGDDRIIGGAGADTLSGGDDRDTLLGGTIGDAVDGDEGGIDLDTLDLTGAGPLKIIYDPSNPENGTVQFLDPTDRHVVGTMTFKNIENVIPCFTPGTMIATPRGEVAVEHLRPGDRVITRDNGMQEIRWLGRRDLSRADLAAASHLKPILIRAGSLGDGLPERDMMVSPNHRLLVANDRTALYFEEHEVLVAAKHLVAARGIDAVDAAGMSYIHFMCDRHEVVLSNGAWSESFQPGDMTLKGMGNSQRSEIFELFPELATEAGLGAYVAARRTLKRHEAALIAS